MLFPCEVHNYSTFIKLLFFSTRGESHGPFATVKRHDLKGLGQERTWTNYFKRWASPKEEILFF